jgi:ADP-ribose pyrophosphatase
MIDHPGSVVLVPLLGDQVVLVRQYRWTLGQTILELPAGTRHPDESPELCAQRELREETGYRAGRLTPLGSIWPAPGLTNEQMHLFLARDLSADPLPMDADEQIENCLVPFSAALEMARNGTFSDAKTIIALLRAADA